jgi:hypothetical protein
MSKQSLGMAWSISGIGSGSKAEGSIQLNDSDAVLC